MLHRPFGNLDDVIHGSLPFLKMPSPDGNKYGIVESVDEKTYIVKIRDCESGQRGIECVVLQQQFSAYDKTGSLSLPIPESKVLYYMTGGNQGVILGNIVNGVLSPGQPLTAGLNGNPGFENFGSPDDPTAIDIASDFGWGPGDWGCVNERGKIKLMRSGVIVLKSSPFCYQYMFPARQERRSSFLIDEERGIGYIKRRRTFVCKLPGSSFNANYKMEQIDDIPSDPQTTLREEKGFCDKPTSYNSLNHQSEIDISGFVASAIASSVEVMKARAIRRTTIAKAAKVQGQRTIFTPVYKKEERVDGTVVEQSGHLPGQPFYNLEIIKSPIGYMHIICRKQQQPIAVFTMDANTGQITIAANGLALASLTQPLTIIGSDITLNAAQSFTVNAPAINLNASAQLGLTSQGPAQLAGAVTDINAQSVMTINAPAISSSPVPAVLPPPVPPTPPSPILASVLPIIQDNTPMEEDVRAAD